MSNLTANNSSQNLVSISLTLLSIAYVLFQNKRISDKLKNKVVDFRRKKKVGSVNIGGVFGMDVGGTLTKIVYFEPKRDISNETNVNKSSSSKSSYNTTERYVKTDTITGKQPERLGLTRGNSSDSLAQLDCPDHQAALEQLYSFMDNSKALQSTMNNSVIRDDILSEYSTFLQGKLHFLHFETRNMVTAIKYLSSSSALVENIRTIGCTGGGAHKFASEFEEELEITFDKFDELLCLVRGMHFALNNFEDECFTYRKSDFVSNLDLAAMSSTTSTVDSKQQTAAPDIQEEEEECSNLSTYIKNESISDKQWRKDIKEYTKRVTLHQNSLSSLPYLVVNIGSGVSILKVTGPGKAERVSGTSLGGGTYWGLCRLLTSCESFEEVLNCAEQGDASVVDMLVRDIYGGDYTGSLTGGMVASSFGKLVSKEKPREGVKEEDLALALLMMITNNIGQVAYLTAQLQKCSQIYFVGNFLRHNPISCRRLAFAIDFWSSGKMEALFLVHEGYFGALGTFLTSAFKDEVDKIISIKHTLTSSSTTKQQSTTTTNTSNTLTTNQNTYVSTISNNHYNESDSNDKDNIILNRMSSSPNRMKSAIASKVLLRGRSFSEDTYNLINNNNKTATTTLHQENNNNNNNNNNNKEILSSTHNNHSMKTNSIE